MWLEGLQAKSAPKAVRAAARGAQRWVRWCDPLTQPKKPETDNPADSLMGIMKNLYEEVRWPVLRAAYALHACCALVLAVVCLTNVGHGLRAACAGRRGDEAHHCQGLGRCRCNTALYACAGCSRICAVLAQTESREKTARGEM